MAGLAMAAVLLNGCAYRLMSAPPPAHGQLIRIVAASPGQYTLRAEIRDYRVPPNGRLEFLPPARHHGCPVYLFDRIPLHRAPDHYREKNIAILRGGVVVRRLSMLEYLKLPEDAGGYRQLTADADR